jgi:L-lactate dehydrogenase (cytochrome)
LSLGATACSFGKSFLYALSAGGQNGVEVLLKRMREEITRDMILLGCKNIKELNKNKIAYR